MRPLGAVGRLGLKQHQPRTVCQRLHNRLPLDGSLTRQKVLVGGPVVVVQMHRDDVGAQRPQDGSSVFDKMRMAGVVAESPRSGSRIGHEGQQLPRSVAT